MRTVIAAAGRSRYKPSRGAIGQATLARLARAYPYDVVYPRPPTNLVNFGEAVDFPLIFGCVLVVSGVATLTHMLVVSTFRGAAGKWAY